MQGQSPTYGQLAAQTINELFPTFQENFPTLTSASVPAGVSALRKATLYVRDALDVFPYAYPLPKSGRKSLFINISFYYLKIFPPHSFNFFFNKKNPTCGR